MNNLPTPPKISNKAVAIGATVVLGIFALASSWYTIDETERGVLLRNGALVGVIEPGLSFKVPFIESVKLISIQSQVTLYDRLQAYSKDQQAATLRVSVSWHVAPSEVAKGLYRLSNQRLHARTPDQPPSADASRKCVWPL